MKWLTLILTILSALRKNTVSDQSVVNTPASPLQDIASAFSEGSTLVADVKEDIADIKAGHLPTDIVKQIEDVEAFAATVLTLGATLSADFGVSPAVLKSAIPEVIALAKKIL